MSQSRVNRPEMMRAPDSRPARYLVCDRCHRAGGTLVKIEPNVYQHQTCQRAMQR